MKQLLSLFLIYTALNAAVFAQTPALGNPADLPFTLNLEEVTQDELPGFHSMAFAQWNGWWIIIGGRVGGLHGFFAFTAFPENEANTDIWIIDPETGDAMNYSVDALNVPFHDPLKATNPQYVQDGDRLYICGGYGKDAGSGDFITFPILTAVDLPKLVTAMQAHSNPSGAFRQIESEKLRVCGGEMEKLGDYFYLVGGHDFSGTYSQQPNPAFTQVYTNEIRKFKITDDGSVLSLSDYSMLHDEQNLHRRDFTLSPLIRPDGSSALCLHGGVFRPDADLPYYNPVYIAEDQTLSLDASYEQVFSQYTCPTVPMFDSTDGAMYTLFFAGLSAYYFDAGTQKVTYDERVPFIRDISTFRRKADGSSREFLMPQQFDALLGANMIFVPAENAPFYDNEVLKFHQLKEKTFVGYLFGGIKADIPNLTPSSASKRMFKVYIAPKNVVGTAESDNAALALKISPNPVLPGQNLRIEAPSQCHNFLIYNAAGVKLAQFGNELSAVQTWLERAPAGVYFIHAMTNDGAWSGKCIKM